MSINQINLQEEESTTFFYDPLLPQTTSDKENVDVAVEAAQAILTGSVIVIPIFPTIPKITFDRLSTSLRMDIPHTQRVRI
jgi:hypothetical protein